MYSHHREAHSQQRNITEACDTQVFVKQTTPNELIFMFKKANQSYQIVPFSVDEVKQLETPFKVRFTDAGEVTCITTEENESIRALTIKNQIAKFMLPNLNIEYQKLLKTEEKTSNFAVTLNFANQLPFGVCNASGNVNENEQKKLKTIVTEIEPSDCNVVSLGGGKLAEFSKFSSKSTFDEDNTLQERQHKMLLVLIAPDGEHQTKIEYEYFTKFNGFEPESTWSMDTIKVRALNLVHLSHLVFVGDSWY